MYLAHTILDLAYVLSVVIQFMHSPSEEHMNAINCILRYLKSSPRKGILFKKGGDLKIEGYTDANWVGSIKDRQSTSGYFTFVGGNLVTWRSKKQEVVARSSAEAEYRGMGKDQLVDVLTKAVSYQTFNNCLDKLGMSDIYAPT
ncbi:secreted RxLR effector protein 161-like [Aristolochia californica]|uniref:secreted RxLR effector protein 161-like n=1 Tax=Aristolochia californica TaxID=171875 RepID=UPI0035DFE3F8